MPPPQKKNTFPIKIIDLLITFFILMLTFLTSDWNIKNPNIRKLEQYLERSVRSRRAENTMFGNIHGYTDKQI